MHYQDEQVEITKVVVGPMDNNVFVVRCRETGDAVMLDAANEHDKLLDLCKKLNVRKVLETHGHWDHIQAVPQVRDAGYEVGVTAEDASMLPAYDFVLEDESVIPVGRLRLSTIHTPGQWAWRWSSSLLRVPTPSLPANGARATVLSTPSALPLESRKALPESPGMPGVRV